jgi:polyisoprenoid-binding protein YceI
MMMKRTVLSALFAVASGLAFAAPQTYNVDPTHTYAGYEIGHVGLSLQHGLFTQVGGTLTVDDAAHSGTVDVTIDAASLSTDYAARDKHLKSDAFFNVAKYPTLTFKASQLKYDGDKLTDVAGTLTLLGVSKPLTLHVTHFAHAKNPMSGKDSYGVNAEGWIKRSDFGMTTYLPAIADDVKLQITLEAIAAN